MFSWIKFAISVIFPAEHAFMYRWHLFNALVIRQIRHGFAVFVISHLLDALQKL